MLGLSKMVQSQCDYDLLEFEELARENSSNPDWLFHIAHTTSNTEIQWLAYSLLKTNHTNYQQQQLLYFSQLIVTKKILWNEWRKKYPKVYHDLSGINLNDAHLEFINFNTIRLNNSELNGTQLSQANLSFAELNGTQLSQANLSKAILKFTELQDTNLSKAILEEANLQSANLKGADLTWAQLKSANLSRAELAQADLSGAFLRWTILNEANLNYAILKWVCLTGATLREAELNYAQCNRADLKWSDFTQASFKEADLSGADLSWANLSQADLTGANLTGANLTGANLTGADLSSANLTGANLSQANLDFANFKNANLTKVFLKDTEITLRTIIAKKQQLVWAIINQQSQPLNLVNADLSRVNLRGADLSGLNLNQANLSQSDLSAANLSKTQLQSANLKGANLAKANLSSAVLCQADLTDANLTETNLLSADLTGVINHSIPNPCLLVLNPLPNNYLPLTENITCSIGRAKNNQLIIRHPSISRQHALIQQENGIFSWIDLGSRNGSYINKCRAINPVMLKTWDCIKIGQIELIFQQDQSSKSSSATCSKGCNFICQNVDKETLISAILINIDNATSLSQYLDDNLLSHLMGSWFHNSFNALSQQSNILYKFRKNGVMIILFHQTNAVSPQEIIDILTTINNLELITLSLAKAFHISFKISVGINTGHAIVPQKVANVYPTYRVLDDTITSCFDLQSTTKKIGVDIAIDKDIFHHIAKPKYLKSIVQKYPVHGHNPNVVYGTTFGKTIELLKT